MNNLVNSEGAAKMTMYTILTEATLNIVLNTILIYTLN